MTRSTPLVRQWLMLKILSARRFGASVQELAKELEVHEKTIRRDLQLFIQAGFPLEEHNCEHGRKTWRIATPAGGGEISFALDEALALYLGRRFLEPLAGTYVWEAAQSAFKKVRASLGPAALRYLDQMTANLHLTAIGTSDYSHQAELVDTLMQAIEERKAVILLYRSLKATEPVEYEVCPYGLAYHKGSLYLVAYSRDHDEVRHFKVDRMSEIEPGRFPFHMPAAFDLARHFARSFGVFQGDGDIHVCVRFLPPVVRYVEESHWHASQKLSQQMDGSLLADFRLDGTEEIKRWLLSFGRNAIVLEPVTLQQEMTEEAASMLSSYHTESRTAKNDLRSRSEYSHISQISCQGSPEGLQPLADQHESDQ